ncbi:Uncharacterised protein [Delftia tsuruhatensis]|uniref:hypothetical protein n=1 Tax=Delftia tsuruhatensis TaxID=180282 RepID=UPI001E7CE49E|nr:hypothetical protein [Delftia tsuruhatensis]CAB5663200.1 Uncharacterised protein [Delftia tsuruhatensis]CAC9677292.1 Uncharacterised protein [Delftia tsuruhatensis]
MDQIHTASPARRVGSGGMPQVHPSKALCERTAAQYAGSGSYIRGRDWQALVRLLDREQPEYRT